MKLLYGQDDMFADWAERHFRINFRPCSCIGFIYDNKIIGCVIYNNFHRDMDGRPLTIDASVLMLENKPLTKYNLLALFSYPFSGLDVRRLQVRVARKKKRLRKLCERLGFTFEGILREAHHDGTDAALYSLLRTEWQNGKFSPIVSQSHSHSRRTNIL